MQVLTEFTWDNIETRMLYFTVRDAKRANFRVDIILRIVAEALNDLEYDENHYAQTTKDKGGN